MPAARARVEADLQAQLGRRSAAHVRFFSGVFERSLRKSFHSIRLANRLSASVLREPSLVLYCNHSSWWDGALFLFIAERLLDARPVYTPMDAGMVTRYGFFSRIGAFSVDRSRPDGALRFLSQYRFILADPRNALLMAAQGRFADHRERPLALDAGISHIASVAPRAVFIPLAIEYCFWQEKRPELLMRFGQPVRADELSSTSSSTRLDLLERALTAAMDALRADAVARRAAAFEVLLAGKRGINPFYDAWRRLSARLHGRPYRAGHGAGS